MTIAQMKETKRQHLLTIVYFCDFRRNKSLYILFSTVDFYA
ncbi:hypothetical protein [Parageobacillus toebii]|nr:hypothetical protein [Parageobacillus toebii]